MKIICPHCNFENKIFENPQLKECLKCKKDIRTNNLNVPERLIMFIFVVGGAIIMYNSICISLSLFSEYKNKFPKGDHPLRETIGYTDMALRKFFEKAKKKNWFKIFEKN